MTVMFQIFQCDKTKLGEIAPVEIENTASMILTADLDISDTDFNGIASESLNNFFFRVTHSDAYAWQFEASTFLFDNDAGQAPQAFQPTCGGVNLSSFVVKSDLPEINGAYQVSSDYEEWSNYATGTKLLSYFDNGEWHSDFENAAGQVVASRSYPDGNTNNCMSGTVASQGPWTGVSGEIGEIHFLPNENGKKASPFFLNSD